MTTYVRRGRPKKAKAEAPTEPPADDAKPTPTADRRWSMYLIAAAVAISMPTGEVGIRVVHNFKIAPSPEAARDWFIEIMEKAFPQFMIIDLSMGVMTDEAMHQALLVSQRAASGATQ